MERSRSWKKADYPNRIPSWVKHKNRKFEMQSEKRDKYFDKLKWDSHPRDFIKNFKLYAKYARLTKSPIDQNKKRVYENSVKNMRLLRK